MTEFCRIVEGKTPLIVPEHEKTKGPLKRARVFYNPSMEMCRDISVMVLSSLNKEKNKEKEMIALDGLAGTGARGIRFAREISPQLNVSINDVSVDAFEVIKKNIELNSLENAIAYNTHVNTILLNNRYDYIDLDPYGHFADYIEPALISIAESGVIGATATDLPVLFGLNNATCIERYSAVSIKTEFMYELGIRILLAFCERKANKYKKSIEPLLVHGGEHYIRVYFRVRESPGEKNIGGLHYKKDTGERKVVIETEGIDKRQLAGPIWIRPIMSPSFISSLPKLTYMGTWKRIMKYLFLAERECKGEPFYYTLDDVCRRLKLSPPPLDLLMKRLREMGYKATHTHFIPTGFKTDAPIEDIKSVFTYAELKGHYDAKT